jgi:AcrR family transcriptional regulator
MEADERRAQRRERLLEACLELLGTDGWQATTVTAVCERARLTPRYFYESFKDRDELLAAIFDAIVLEVTDEVRGALAPVPTNPHETVRATVAAWVEVATEDPRKGRIVFVEALGGSEALMRKRLLTMRRFAELISSQARTYYGVSPGDSRALDLAAIVVAGGLVQTMIEWLEGGLEHTAEEVVEDYAKVCAASLEAAVPGSYPAIES